MNITQKDIERLKKDALMVLELSPDTKTQITNTEIAMFVQKTKKLIAKKDILIFVLEK